MVAPAIARPRRRRPPSPHPRGRHRDVHAIRLPQDLDGRGRARRRHLVARVCTSISRRRKICFGRAWHFVFGDALAGATTKLPGHDAVGRGEARRRVRRMDRPLRRHDRRRRLGSRGRQQTPRRSADRRRRREVSRGGHQGDPQRGTSRRISRGRPQRETACRNAHRHGAWAQTRVRHARRVQRADRHRGPRDVCAARWL